MGQTKTKSFLKPHTPGHIIKANQTLARPIGVRDWMKTKNRIDVCDEVEMILQRIGEDIRKNGMAFVIVAIFLVICNFLFGTVCPIAFFFGVPCPGCGMTRAAFALLRGDFRLAAQYNATIYLWALYGVLWLIDRYVIAKKGKLSTVLLIVVCLLTLGYYFYRICTGTMVDVGTPGKVRELFDFLLHIV